jgi:hypothetical protein
MPPEICPNCGAEVPPRALCCPECGADEKSGWSDRAQTQRLGLPDEEFDYDRYVREEFGEPDRPSAVRPRGIGRLWWVVAAVLVLLFLSRYFRIF